MALQEYQCDRCGKRELAFDGEPLQQGNCGKVTRWCHNFIELPPRPSVVVATAMYMQEFQLDSWATVYELDRLLNIEAREAKELEVYQHFKTNV